jgi:hypothetical protein
LLEDESQAANAEDLFPLERPLIILFKTKRIGVLGPMLLPKLIVCGFFHVKGGFHEIVGSYPLRSEESTINSSTETTKSTKSRVRV